MLTVYKYSLAVMDVQRLMLPINARIVLVAAQGDTLCLWAEVAPNVPLEERVFHIYGTGHPIPETGRTHVGSVVMPPFVWHVYEATR